ncbi:MAG: FAD-dependent oxidoreductase [Candidatus Uhrbacteria bacterium]|nr:FAD-dependent oxidoreductase [Candidatus Uhrbacteria bacterium]
MKTIPATSHEAVLSSKKLVAENTYEIGFTFEADFYFLPGQYIWLKVPKLLFDDQHGNQRAFSILLSPQDKRTIYICFRDSQSGFKKTLLGLPIGAKVTINGPFGGNFCLADQINRYVFAAGGTGISSFLSVLRDGHTWENDKHITFFLANRSKESAPYLEELEALSRTQKKFELHEVFGDITAESVSFVQSAPDAL